VKARRPPSATPSRSQLASPETTSGGWFGRGIEPLTVKLLKLLERVATVAVSRKPPHFANSEPPRSVASTRSGSFQ
jgi:hypothetical protein